MLLFLVAVITWLLLYMVFPSIAIGIWMVAGLVVLSIFVPFDVVEDMAEVVMFFIVGIATIRILKEWSSKERKKKEKREKRVLVLLTGRHIALS